MASVRLVDWFPFWQHAPLMPVVSQLICDFLFRHFASYFDRSLRSSFVWGVAHLPDYFSTERQRDVRYVHLVCGSSCDTRHPHNVLMYYKPKPSGTLPLWGVIIRSVHTCVTYLFSQLRKYEIIVPNYEYFGIKKGALGLELMTESLAEQMR